MLSVFQLLVFFISNSQEPKVTSVHKSAVRKAHYGIKERTKMK